MATWQVSSFRAIDVDYLRLLLQDFHLSLSLDRPLVEKELELTVDLLILAELFDLMQHLKSDSLRS